MGSTEALTIAPTTASVALGGTQQFTATPAAGVNWTANAGTVTANGLYIAPNTAGTYTVTATSIYGNATAVVTVGSTGALTIAPTTASVALGGTYQFTATPATGVNWTANAGTVTANGLYIAPNTARYLHRHRHQHLRHRHRRRHGGFHRYADDYPHHRLRRPRRHLSVYRHPRDRSELDGQCRHGHRQRALYRPEYRRYLYRHRHQHLRHRRRHRDGRQRHHHPRHRPLHRHAAARNATAVHRQPRDRRHLDDHRPVRQRERERPLYRRRHRWNVHGDGQQHLRNGDIHGHHQRDGLAVHHADPDHPRRRRDPAVYRHPQRGRLWTSTSGTVSANGLYTAGATAGTFTVTATSAYGTATATVIITGSTTTTQAIGPSSVTLLPGTQQQFIANPATGVTWTTTDPTGSVNTTGLYTAGTTAGTYTVTAGSTSGTGTSTVTISATASQTITPALATLAAGATQQFTATPNVGVSWTSTGGNVSANGLYTAGATAGTYTVTASSANGTASATVVIGGTTSTTLTIGPSQVTLAPSGTQQFTAHPAGAVTWTCTGGTITANGGLYTAGAAVGSYTVTATSTNGTASATVTIATTGAQTITPTLVTLNTGQTAQFTATPAAGATWTCTGGAVTTTGFYTAGTTAGSYTVTVSGTNGTAVATVIVSSTTTTTGLTIGPSQVTLMPGSTQQFTASPAAGVTWTTTDTSGTISATGLYTAGNASGAYMVTATLATGTATANVTVSTTAAFTIAPTLVTLSPGQTQAFTATPATGVAWTATGGTITANGIFTAGATPGSFTVTATGANGTAAATVIIATTSLSIGPSQVTLLPGATQQYTANPATGVSWTSTGGTISATGLYTAGTATGGYTVTATSASGTATATVTISTTGSQTITPTTVTLAPGGTQLFTATPAAVTWSTSDPSGSITTAGLYTAGATAGTYTVTATGLNGTASATVTVSSSTNPTVSLAIGPSQVTLQPGSTQQFTAYPATGVTWTATGGTISANGLYTAGATVGNYTVTSTSANGTATANVTISSAGAQTVSPALVNLNTGATQQFTANPAGVTWTATGGTITATGLFTAGATAGVYTVTSIGIHGTAAATVIVGQAFLPVLVLAIGPAQVTILPGASQQFTANPNAGVTWNATGGTIDANGLFLAGTAVGSYTVTATSVNGTASATVTVSATGAQTIIPTLVSLAPGSTQTFIAVPNIGVTWTATGGTVNYAGLFTAGPTAGTYLVTATSPSGVAAATILITTGAVPTNQLPGYDEDPNDYLELRNPVGRAGVGTKSATSTTGIDASGSWNFGSTGGNPLVPQDDNSSLVDRAEAYLYVNGATTETEVGVGGWFDKAPYCDTYNEVAGYTWDSGTAIPGCLITVVFKLSLVRDVAKWEYDITNNGPTTQSVAFRTLEDLKFIGLPGNAYLLPPASQHDTTVQELVGTAVPDEWDVSYTPAGDTPAQFAGEPLLRARQPLTQDSGVTVPSRLVFAPYPDVQNYTWPTILNPVPGVTPIPVGQALLPVQGQTASLAVGNYYALQYLLPRQTRVISGQIQLNWSRVKTDGHDALGVAGTESLQYYPGQDPANPNNVYGYYEPAQVSIRAYACDSAEVVSSTVTATVSPGQGLKLVPGQSSTIQTQVGVMQDQLLTTGTSGQQTSWTLVPDGTANGLIPVTVNTAFVPASNTGNIQTIFYVNVPQKPTRTFTGGALQFVGFPFTFNPPDPSAVLVDLGQPLGSRLAWYDPVQEAYQYGQAVTLNPGGAYWLNLQNVTLPLPLTLRGAQPLDQTQTRGVQLARGWNAVSNPFQYAVAWGNCLLYDQDETYTVADAIHQGLIDPFLWTWNPADEDYATWNNPNPSSLLAQPLQPGAGYWLYATAPAGLVFQPDPNIPAMTREGDSPLEPKRTRGTDGAWQVSLKVAAGSAQDAENVLGMAATTNNTYAQLRKPPQSPTGLSSYLAAAGGRGRLAQDLRPVSSSATWEYDVECAPTYPNVTVSYSGL